MRRVAPLILAVLALLPAAAAAKSNDSLAPPDAPPHWLPPEAWVYNHWIPYDEGRLYALLHITREQLWQQLRDDHRNIAQLAARHGWRDPGRLADALVAPWRGHVSAARVAVLRGRAVRTITQGHLSQHLFFHSLHQFAIPSRAPQIFGLSDAAFRDVRRTLELSPLTIARLHGRSPARVEALSVAALRERARAGVAGHAITARQARMLLRRQITQLPRWLGQARYNGPPKTHHGLLVALPHDYATNPSVSADGTHVVYEQYRQKLPVALRLGEIAVVSRDLRSGRDTLVSRPAAPRPNQPLDPRSAYNATVSGDGRLVAYESSPGNVNFAKRYGRIGVHLADTARGTHDADRPSPARRGPLAVGLQPAAGRRRAPPRLPGRARRRHGAGLRLRPAHRLADAGQRRAAARAARDRHLDLRAAALGRRALRRLHRRHEPRERRARRDRLERRAARPRRPYVDDGERGRRWLRLGSDRVRRRPPGGLHGRRGGAAALPARPLGRHGEGAHDARCRRRRRPAALRRRPRARLHRRARRAQPRRGPPPRQRRRRAGREREGVGDRSVALRRRQRPGLHLRRARPRPGQDRPQPRRLRARPARRHDDARERADQAGAGQAAAADGDGPHQRWGP